MEDTMATESTAMARGALRLSLRLRLTHTMEYTALAMLAMALAMEDTMATESTAMARGALRLRLRLSPTGDMALAMPAMALAMEDTMDMELEAMAGASKGIFWLISVFGYFCSSLFAFEKCLSSTDAQ